MHRDDKMRIGVRSLSLIALLLMAALLAACGGESKPEPRPAARSARWSPRRRRTPHRRAPQRGRPGA